MAANTTQVGSDAARPGATRRAYRGPALWTAAELERRGLEL